MWQREARRARQGRVVFRKRDAWELRLPLPSEHIWILRSLCSAAAPSPSTVFCSPSGRRRPRCSRHVHHPRLKLLPRRELGQDSRKARSLGGAPSRLQPHQQWESLTRLTVGIPARRPHRQRGTFAHQEGRPSVEGQDRGAPCCRWPDLRPTLPPSTEEAPEGRYSVIHSRLDCRRAYWYVL